MSAKSLDRPGVQYALELLKNGDAAALVVSKMDRLCRNLSDFARTMDDARREGWKLVALDTDVDMTTDIGEAIAGVRAVFAQWERRRLSRRTREGLAAARAKGQRLGRTTGAAAAPCRVPGRPNEPWPCSLRKLADQARQLRADQPGQT